ncbi:hypothetical protein C0995_005558 [Termitomyces sp. Mi166|nr:hypothetical protein C0995_005558 [Termitomyces sp. Mi166\
MAAVLQKYALKARLWDWLSKCSKLPVPRVLSPVVELFSDKPDHYFFVTDKIPGTINYESVGPPGHGCEEFYRKKRAVQSFAEFSLELFRLPVPENIGTFGVGLSLESSGEIIPRIAGKTHRPNQSDFLLEIKKD